MIANTLALSLAATEPFTVLRAEAERGDGQANLLVYDDAGNVAASIILSTDASGLHVDADFADGVWVTFDPVDGSYAVQSNDPEQARGRMQTIANFVGPDTTMEGWGSCLFSAAGTVAGCVAVQYWACTIGAYATTCDCLPLLIEEFEEIECPGW